MSQKPEKDFHLPLSRVKTIMKSSPDVEAVGPEPLYLVTKVTEFFVIDLAKRAFKSSNNSQLEYKHIADIVQEQIIRHTYVFQEFFVIDLAKRAFKSSNNSQLEYKHIADIVQEDETLDFLREIMPRKITVRQFKEIMAKKAARANNSDDESSERSSEEETSEDTSTENDNQD